MHLDPYFLREKHRLPPLISSGFEEGHHSAHSDGFLYVDAYSFRLSIFHLGMLPSVEVISHASMLFLLRLPYGPSLQREFYGHFANFISLLLRRNYVGLSAIIYALYLVAKFIQLSSHKHASFDLYSLFLISQMLSCKFLYDTIFSNAFWATSSSLFSVAQVNYLERQFLAHIQYDFWSINLSIWYDALSIFFNDVRCLCINNDYHPSPRMAPIGMRPPQIATRRAHAIY